MDIKERKFKVKNAIMGGGLALREGEIVSEDQLGGHIEQLRRLGGIEEVHEVSVSRPSGHQTAYSA